MQLTDHVTLGRSGLRVSPLCLGTMTFGTAWGWGADEATARAVFDAYVDAGGNFVDTADIYTGGQSEELVGRFVADRGLRDRLVLATKFTFNLTKGDPNAGGNGRKLIRRAVEASLRRLGTDRLDLYWLHCWDMVTPVDEVMRTLDDLVRDGKVLHVGLSDVPAWYAARAQTLAELRGLEPVVALQLEYSLVERGIERELVPAAQELGMAITPWSPLAGGFLAGKYPRDGGGEGRLAKHRGSGNPAFDRMTARNYEILDVAQAVAAEIERPVAQVALAWLLGRPGVTSTIIGARSVEQLQANLGALDLALHAEQRARLDEVSKLVPGHPYLFFSDYSQGMMYGGARVTRWRPA
ncbi:MAG: aldo/keto reductase [Kofleriaceae bacterium]|nr:aldo/keto reductase [Kofleriaceae bacterium]MCL4228329.1 aldo/keto reductase [Myxococcales bacterium]